MSKSGININISGGAAVLGNISQGDGNHLDNNQTSHIDSVEMQQFYRALESLVADNQAQQADYLALRADMQQLLKQSPPEGTAEALKVLYEKYAWAATPLKALLGAVLA